LRKSGKENPHSTSTRQGEKSAVSQFRKRKTGEGGKTLPIVRSGRDPGKKKRFLHLISRKRIHEINLHGEGRGREERRGEGLSIFLNAKWAGLKASNLYVSLIAGGGRRFC